MSAGAGPVTDGGKGDNEYNKCLCVLRPPTRGPARWRRPPMPAGVSPPPSPPPRRATPAHPTAGPVRVRNGNRKLANTRLHKEEPRMP